MLTRWSWAVALLAAVVFLAAGVFLAAFAQAGPKGQVSDDPKATRQRYDDNQSAIAAAYASLQQSLPGDRPVLTVQLGHSRAISSLALSTDGRLLLTGSDDRTARLWSVAGGRELRRFISPSAGVSSVALSADGKLVATGGLHDDMLRVWDTATGAQRLALSGNGKTIGALAFLPDGKTLAAVGWDNALHLWDLPTAKKTRQLDKALNGLSAIFAPDGKTVLTADASAKKAWLLDVDSGAVVKRLELKDEAQALSFSKDGALAALATYACDAKADHCKAQVVLWDLQRDAAQKLPPLGDVLIRALALSPDKTRLAVGTGVGVLGKCESRCVVQLIELPSARELWRQAAFSADFRQLTFSADGKSLIAAGNDSAVRVFDAASGRALPALGGEVDPVSAVALSPDGKWLAVGSGNAVDLNRSARALSVSVWDLRAGREARRLALVGGAVSNLSFSADSKLLAAGSRGDPEDCAKCTARLWEVQSGRELQSFPAEVRRGGFALSPDGRMVAGGAIEGDANEYSITLWEARTGKPLWRAEMGEQWAFAFAPNQAALAMVGGAGDVTLRDVKTGKEQRSLTDTNADMRPCVAFSPDGKLVAAGATSLYSSAVWAYKTGKVVGLLDGHSRDVTDIKLGRNGLVATTSLDGTALLWAARGGKLARVLAGHYGGVTAVAFSADGKLVITGSLDGTARLWQTATGRPLAQLISVREGGWLVLAADGHYDSDTPERGGWHFVAGNEVLPAQQAQSLAQSAREPGLLRRILTGRPASTGQ